MGTLHGEFHRTIKVRADTARLAEIRRFVDEVAAELALDVECAFDLKVAVSEACANAVQHSGCDPVPLEVCAQLQSERLTFIVTDKGLFRPICRHGEDFKNARGLGLPLMVALMDEVSFARAPGGGTVVSLSVLLDRRAATPA